ncbi:hypothetical protein GJ744_001512 [Endocarpon pusillum]|uniref:Extracellular membrane protein CFEM domain-containing protein n=1 Tax=Endocarpon pusillum TaxID=364733 RepID=A0A8H7AD95_9EURO|nr:hypothetical protein GJ744_001512 [Endocarpon pusillum]
MYSIRSSLGVLCIFLLAFLLPGQTTSALKNYDDCASVWIVRRLGDTACLPPTTDCLCYADALYIQNTAIDIAAKCQGANDLQDAADTFGANCAELDVTPALDKDGFFAAGRFPASDTIFSAATSFDINTVPAAATATDVQTSVIRVSYPTQGVTTIPGDGPGPCVSELTYLPAVSLACEAASSASSFTLSVGPASVPASSTTGPPAASSTTKRSGAEKTISYLSGIGRKIGGGIAGVGLLSYYLVL